MSFGIGLDGDEAKAAVAAIRDYLSRKTTSTGESAQTLR